MTPHELVARHVAPHIKALVAHELAERGLSQKRIAYSLGVTQAMVSKYVAREKQDIRKALSDAGVDPDEAAAVAKLLASVLERERRADYMRVLTAYLNTLLVTHKLCSLHQRLTPGLPRDCRICDSLFTYPEDPVVVEVREAYERLARHPCAPELVPEVGLNIVAARPRPTTIADIVGYAGRIVRVGDAVEAVGQPVYGGSRHTATILLLANRLWPGIRAAIVVRHPGPEAVEEAARHYTVLIAGPHSDPARVYSELEEVLERHARSEAKPPDAVVDEGGHGLEPVMYVFAETAPEAVEKALAIATLRGPCRLQARQHP